MGLDKKTLKKAALDAELCAKAAKLRYVSNADNGIERAKQGKGFSYTYKTKKVEDKKILERILALVIPPAWEDVWICRFAKGHLQATGFDVANRKQYIYHPSWHEVRQKTKFYRILQFGKTLPTFRKQFKKDLSRHGFPKEKALAALCTVLMNTGIRIGNAEYEKRYGSYGLTTMKSKHAKIDGESITFSFKGKKGVKQKILLEDKKLTQLLKACRAIPGSRLFQYLDEDGNPKPLDADMVNNYLTNISGSHFTAKDFRTWIGSVQALMAMEELGCAAAKKEVKQNVNIALDAASKRLGNTRTVCKKYYVHPGLLDAYECKMLDKYLSQNTKSKKPTSHGLTSTEQTLLKVLDNFGK